MPDTLPAHVQWLATHRGAALERALAAQGVVLSAVDALAVMIRVDPSPGLHGVQWLADTLVGGGVRWEDLAGGRASKAGITLDLFAQYRRGLPRGQRNLEDHPGLGEVYAAILPMLPRQDGVGIEPAGRALRRQQRAEAYRDSRVLYNTPELIVAVPLSQMAACWWGRGTRWCTAADKDNMFDGYNQVAPLVVLVMPRLGIKLQLHISDAGDDEEYNNVQFMDELDRQVGIEFIHANWALLGGVIAWACGQDGQLLANVPVEHRDHATCLAAVSHYPYALPHVPYEVLDDAICWAGMGRDASCIQWVPQQFLSNAMCMQAVRCDGSLLAYVPPVMQTRQMCMLAISGSRGHGDNIVHAADADIEMWLLAIECTPGALRLVPDHMLSPTMCLVAVGLEGGCLQHVPWEWRTPELCALALAKDSLALAHVPHELQTHQMVMSCALKSENILRLAAPHLRTHDFLLELVGRCSERIREIPPEFRTRQLWGVALPGCWQIYHKMDSSLLDLELTTIAVQANGRLLKLVPEALRTHSVCTAAVASTSQALAYVPQQHRTQELYRMAVEGMGHNITNYEPGSGGFHSLDMLACLPRELMTPMLCAKAVWIEPNALRSVPPEFVDLELATLAVWGNSSAIQHVPTSLQTPEICLMAIDNNPELIRYISLSAQTPQVLMGAISNKSYSLYYIDSSLVTPELCIMAVQGNPTNIEYVPDSMREQVLQACPPVVRPRPERQWQDTELDNLAICLARHAQKGLNRPPGGANPGAGLLLMDGTPAGLAPQV